MIGIAHCLWFNDEAEEAGRFYVSIFDGRLGRIARYGEEGFEIHHRPAGSVMTVEFSLRFGDALLERLSREQEGSLQGEVREPLGVAAVVARCRSAASTNYRTS